MKKLIGLIICILFSSTSVYAERLWSHTVHDGRDPLTAPQTMVKDFSLKCKYMHSKILIWVDGPSLPQLKEKIAQCGNTAIQTGVLAGAAAAVASGGAAGFSAFLLTGGASFKGCVESIGNGFTIGYDNPTGWSDWQNCF